MARWQKSRQKREDEGQLPKTHGNNSLSLSFVIPQLDKRFFAYVSTVCHLVQSSNLLHGAKI